MVSSIFLVTVQGLGCYGGRRQALFTIRGLQIRDLGCYGRRRQALFTFRAAQLRCPKAGEAGNIAFADAVRTVYHDRCGAAAFVFPCHKL